ncbi:hypothetical protein F5Y17DRAFT_459097 [Xylariaceae sp. FL0594]|nr:hypothetical protein F5Y17DRAFT_459097 [Xylariaceae sp. FL0594]
MRFSILAVTAFAASGTAAAAAAVTYCRSPSSEYQHHKEAEGRDDKKYPPCSFEASIPCLCPPGTQYLEAATTGIIGAHVRDVTAFISDFYNISWQLGAVIYKTQGPDNQVGSIRSVRYQLVPPGMEDVDERLVSHKVFPDGSSVYSFEQVQPSIPYPDGSGVFAGYWGTVSAIGQTNDETIVTWTNWACETANLRNFAAFHEISFQNATDILTAEGKVKGQNVAPCSAKNF